MKFITEDTLRWQYRQAPFESFHVGKDTRLTPEAYQFLVDRRIVVHYEDQKLQPKTGNNKISSAEATPKAISFNMGAQVGVSIEWALAHLFVAQTTVATMCHRSLSDKLKSIHDTLVAAQGAIKTQKEISLAALESIKHMAPDEEFAIHQISVEAPYALFVGQLNLVRVSCLTAIQHMNTDRTCLTSYKQVMAACVCQIEEIIKELAEV